MGFFDKIMKGLGFETKEEPKKIKEKPIKKTVGTYELEDHKEENIEKMPTVFVKSQKDLNRVVEAVRDNEKVLINFSSFPRKEIDKAISFIEGACFALMAVIEKYEDGFVIIPLEKDI